MDQSTASPRRRAATLGIGRRLCDLLRTQIRDGTLPPGAPLPSTRALATEHGVSRTTVTAAYEQLAAEGFIATSAGRAARVVGSTMASAPQEAQPPLRPAPTLSAFGQRVAAMGTPALVPPEPGLIDFLYGAVAARDFPLQVWQRAVKAVSRQPLSGGLYYTAPEGDAALRRALQGYLWRARGLVCEAEQLLVVQGTQQALDLCARLLLNPGDAVVFEEPGYLMARRCFEASGARILATSVDEQGLDTAHLPHDVGARLAYVTPSHQFPLGGVLPVGRRRALLQWAQQHDAWIIEDDYDGEFRYGQRPIDALQSIDTGGRVLYVGTFSKALSPQLRLGYLVLPPALVPVFRQARRLADRHAPVLEQLVLATLIDSGAYERHVRRVRRGNERRRAALLDAVARHLPGAVRVAGSAAGLHIVLWLPGHAPHDEPGLVAAARRSGVGVYPLSPLYAGSPGTVARPAGLILGYASLTPSEIGQGLCRLAQVLARHNPGP